MKYLPFVFWFLSLLVCYTYFGYPLLLSLLVRLKRPLQRTGVAPSSLSVVIAASNEEASIGRRVREFMEAFQRSGFDAELIVVSDGSTDHTAQGARDTASEYPAQRAQVLELPRKSGKACALTTGCAAASKEILVFADVRQTWASDALERLVEKFIDPSVGAASGELVVTAKAPVMQGVGLYWRYEKWIRKNESLLWSATGATGAISSVRRSLFKPIPPGTILDDVYWPLMVVKQGFRVIHEEQALAFDQLPNSPRDEFRRKVRTLSGNFQLVLGLPWTLVPGLNPVWFQFVSHKLLRLAVPWLLLAALGISGILHGPLYGTLFIFQLFAYILGIVGLRWRSKSRIIGLAASFLVLNAAAWAAFWVWVLGKSGRTWNKVDYSGSAGYA